MLHEMANSHTLLCYTTITVEVKSEVFMKASDILDTAQYVVDKHGKQTAVLLDLNSWDTLRRLIEELVEDERLGQLMIAVENDDKLEGEEAHATYQRYLTEAQT